MFYPISRALFHFDQKGNPFSKLNKLINLVNKDLNLKLKIRHYVACKILNITLNNTWIRY